MRKQSFLLVVALALVSTCAFAQDSQTNASSTSFGYINCPTGQSNVFLYQTVTTFDVLSSPRCGDRVEILGHVDTLGGYFRVRTADGKEGFVPQLQVANIAPAKPAVAAAPAPPPLPVPAAQASPLAGLLTHGNSDFGYDIPRIEAFGGYSYLSADWETLATRSGLHGWNGSAGINVFPWLGLEGGISGHYQRNCVGAAGITCTILNITGGPKISMHRGTNLTAFGHGLVGLGSLTMALGASSLSYRNVVYGFGGGVDYAFTNRFSVRLGQVDYLRSEYLKNLGGTHENNIRISGGVVLRLGRLITE